MVEGWVDGWVCSFKSFNLTFNFLKHFTLFFVYHLPEVVEQKEYCAIGKVDLFGNGFVCLLE